MAHRARSSTTALDMAIACDDGTSVTVDTTAVCRVNNCGGWWNELVFLCTAGPACTVKTDDESNPLPPLLGVDLNGADFRGMDVVFRRLDGASLILANFSDANLERASLRDTDLRSANLTGANLTDVKLTGAFYDDRTRFPVGFDPVAAGMILIPGSSNTPLVLHEAVMIDADLQGETIENWDLTGTNLFRADLSDTDFRSDAPSSLQDAYFREANFFGADLEDAVIDGADFFGADFREADLRVVSSFGAIFTTALYTNGTMFNPGFDPVAEGMIFVP